MVCRYYLQGQCLYGDKCRYDHIRPQYKVQSKPGDEELKPKKTGSSLGPVLLPSLSGQGGQGDSRDTTNQPTLVALKRDPSKIPKTWVQAPEFVPGRVFHGEEEEATSTWDVGSHSQPLTYSGVAGAGLEMESEFLDIITTEDAASLMCPFAEMGVCPFGESCEYTHGDLCELCGKECLSPFDPEQRKAHHRECVESHEQEMERAFAAQKSEGKTCGICMEVVLCKVSLSDRRFGILSHCDHCFCLSCIRKWRSSTHARKITIRCNGPLSLYQFYPTLSSHSSSPLIPGLVLCAEQFLTS
jgi:E3 ubiquitin-protein ligase makorin